MDQPRNDLSERISRIAPSATLAVDSLAKRLKAEGRNIIGFGAGEPDFPTPAHIVAAAEDACSRSWAHKYTPVEGLPDLREAIALKTKRDSGFDVSASHVLVTNGAKHAVFNSMFALLDEGDEILIPAPYWVTYPEAARLAGGEVVPVATSESNGFRISVDDLERAATEKTKALVFVSPSNPTGAVHSPSEIEAIGKWAASRGIWVIADEIYEHLTYGDVEHVSMPVVAPEIASRCIVLNGVAKSWAMTGWRVGWMIAPPEVISATAGLMAHSTSNVCNVAQAAALAAVSGSLDSTFQMRTEFDRRRILMHSMLSAMPGVECFEPQGAFYCFPNLTGVIGELSAQAWAANLMDQKGVAIVSGEGFGTPGYARLSYAMNPEDMVEGLSRISEFVAGR